jgi:hypothetical protein
MDSTIFGVLTCYFVQDFSKGKISVQCYLPGMDEPTGFFWGQGKKLSEKLMTF